MFYRPLISRGTLMTVKSNDMYKRERIHVWLLLQVPWWKLHWQLRGEIPGDPMHVAAGIHDAHKRYKERYRRDVARIMRIVTRTTWTIIQFYKQWHRSSAQWRQWILVSNISSMFYGHYFECDVDTTVSQVFNGGWLFDSRFSLGWTATVSNLVEKDSIFLYQIGNSCAEVLVQFLAAPPVFLGCINLLRAVYFVMSMTQNKSICASKIN